MLTVILIWLKRKNYFLLRRRWKNKLPEFNKRTMLGSNLFLSDQKARGKEINQWAALRAAPPTRGLERVSGVEPPFLPWEGSVEPINYTRIIFLNVHYTLPRDRENIPWVNETRIFQIVCFGDFSPTIRITIRPQGNIPEIIALHNGVFISLNPAQGDVRLNRHFCHRQRLPHLNFGNRQFLARFQ